MKGKIKNLKFYSQYISKCAEDNIYSSNEILNKAKSRVIEIDKELSKILKLQEERSNLLDVIYLLEK